MNGVIKSSSQIYCCHGRVALKKAYNYYQLRQISLPWNYPLSRSLALQSGSLADYPYVDKLGLWYISVNFGAEKGPVSPNWCDQLDREKAVIKG